MESPQLIHLGLHMPTVALDPQSHRILYSVPSLAGRGGRAVCALSAVLLASPARSVLRSRASRLRFHNRNQKASRKQRPSERWARSNGGTLNSSFGLLSRSREPQAHTLNAHMSASCQSRVSLSCSPPPQCCVAPVLTTMWRLYELHQRR